MKFGNLYCNRVLLEYIDTAVEICI